MNLPAPIALSAGLLLGLVASSPSAIAATPKVGESTTDFTLKTPAGEPVRLAALNEKGPVVLVVLRGWPGYQCPYCTKQVGELVAKSKEFDKAKAQVVLVYPGPSSGLKRHAEEFAKGKALPANFSFVVDPDYAFTNAYGLRWEGAGETAYPSTFVIDPQGKVVFAKTSQDHGTRVKAQEVLQALAQN